VELHALERNVPPDKWGVIAGKVWDVVHAVNNTYSNQKIDAVG
jgi:hypothetical protein